MPTGYKFTVRPQAELWSDAYRLRLDDGSRMTLTGDNFLSTGIKLHFMAVSWAYSFNITQQGNKSKYRNFAVGFSCNMLETAFNYRVNNVGANITYLYDGEDEYDDISIRFNGLRTKGVTADATYYFNYRRYTQSAVFGMGRIQLRSAGSHLWGSTTSTTA